MDITNDLIIDIFYRKYLMLCKDYDSGAIDEEEAVNQLKTMYETVGMYVSGLFEIKRQKEGG